MLNPDKIIVLAGRAGADWADKEAAASILEEVKSTLLSSLAVAHIAAGDAIGTAEHKAKADQKYRSHIESMVEARKMANRARVRWINAQMYVELKRTMEASRRAEMKML